MKGDNLPNWCRRTSRTPTLNTSAENDVRKTRRSLIPKIKILSAKKQQYCVDPCRKRSSKEGGPPNPQQNEPDEGQNGAERHSGTIKEP